MGSIARRTILRYVGHDHDIAMSGNRDDAAAMLVARSDSATMQGCAVALAPCVDGDERECGDPGVADSDSVRSHGDVSSSCIIMTHDKLTHGDAMKMTPLLTRSGDLVYLLGTHLLYICVRRPEMLKLRSSD